MRVRKATHLTLTLLVAAGAGVFAGSAQGQSAAPPKSATSSKAGSKAHGKRTSRRSGRRERGQKVPTPDRLSEIQQALAKDDSFTGKPNGKWDASTIEATTKFQGAHGVNASGEADAKPLQQLGLACQTARLRAPWSP